MRPKPVQEVHLVFKAQTPLALRADFPLGNTSSDKQQETQRITRILNSGIYYMHVLGKVKAPDSSDANEHTNGDAEMTNGNDLESAKRPRIEWFLDFKDTPEAGKQVLSSRYTARTLVEEGDVMAFMTQFGYEYTSRYVVEGHKFYEHDTTLFLHRVMRVPDAGSLDDAMNCSFLDTPDALHPLDGHGGYVLQASIDALDGNNQEVKDRATSQLLAIKETLKTAVNLTPGDRLALDTKIPLNARRPG